MVRGRTVSLAARNLTSGDELYPSIHLWLFERFFKNGIGKTAWARSASGKGRR